MHFNLIDAYVSNHGNVGSQVLFPLETRTIIGGQNALLVDWGSCDAMQIDPYLSPLNAKALRLIGLPKDYQVIGPLTPYEGWKNVHPLISAAFFRLDEAEVITRDSWSASFIVDRRLFPWKSRLFHLLNVLISPIWARVDKNPLFLWWIISMNYFFVYVFFLTKGVCAPGQPQAIAARGIADQPAPKDLSEKDYEELLRVFIRPLEEIVESLPVRKGRVILLWTRVFCCAWTGRLLFLSKRLSAGWTSPRAGDVHARLYRRTLHPHRA